MPCRRIGKSSTGSEELVEVAHLRVAREEAEGAATGEVEHAADALGGGLGEFGIAGVGHLWREIEQRLLAVAEVRRHNQLAGFIEAEALADVFEAALHGERGRGEHHGGDGLEDQLVEQFGDVDGRRLKKGAARTFATGECALVCGASSPPFEPIDHVACVRLEQELELRTQTRDTLAQAGGFVDVFQPFELGLHQLESRGGRSCRGRRRFREIPRAR